MALNALWRGFHFAALIALLLTPQLEARPFYRTLFHAFDYGHIPVGVQVGDLNGDGKLDIVAPLYSEPGVMVHFGDGQGDFGPATFLSLPSAPAGCAVALLNTDVHPDLVIANGVGTLSVFYGAGGGSFEPRIDFAVLGNPTGVAVGDINEDGRADVAVTSSTSAKVQVLFGFVDVFFYPVIELSTGLNPGPVALSDFNGDMHLDLAVLNRGSATISVFLGDGAGNFATPASLAGLASMQGMAVADLNGDALSDIAVTMSTTGEAWIYLATGGGGFATPTAYPANATPSGIVAAAVDGDDYPDLLVVNTTPNAVSVLPGNGDGSFAAPISVRTEVSPSGVAAGDLDGDGALDFAVAHPRAISIHLGNGDFTFGTQENTYDVGPGTKVITVSDLDRDGSLDLAVSCAAAATLSLLFGYGDCTFEAGVVLSTPATPQGVAAGDLNEDGLEDLVTVNRTANSYTLYLGTGPRAWAPGVTTALATEPHHCELRDLNADGHLDLVVLKYEFVNVFLGNGDGTFQPYTSYRASDQISGGRTADLEIVDVDGDGVLDLLVSSSGCCPGQVWVFMGHGDGTFESRSEVWLSNTGWASALAAGRLGADEYADLALAVTIAPNGGRVDLLLGYGSGGFGSPATIGLAYHPLWAEAGDVNQDGSDDIVIVNHNFPGTVSAHLGHRDGTFSPRLDFGIGGDAACVRIADLDTDGDADLVVADANSDRVWVLANQRAIPTDTPDVPAVSGGRQPWLVASERADGQVRITYSLTLGTPPVELAVYDVRGRLVRALRPEISRIGQNVCVWDRCGTQGTRVGRGIYFVRLRAQNASATCKVALVRR